MAILSVKLAPRERPIMPILLPSTWGCCCRTRKAVCSKKTQQVLSSDSKYLYKHTNQTCLHYCRGTKQFYWPHISIVQKSFFLFLYFHHSSTGNTKRESDAKKTVNVSHFTIPHNPKSSPTWDCLRISKRGVVKWLQTNLIPHSD